MRVCLFIAGLTHLLIVLLFLGSLFQHKFLRTTVDLRNPAPVNMVISTVAKFLPAVCRLLFSPVGFFDLN